MLLCSKLLSTCLRGFAILSATAPLAHAQVSISCLEAPTGGLRLNPKGECHLTATHPGGGRHAWEWQVEGLGAGSIRLCEEARGVVYHAPDMVLKERTFHVRATHSVTREFKRYPIVVKIPELEVRMENILTELMQYTFGKGWELPCLLAFAGNFPGLPGYTEGTELKTLDPSSHSEVHFVNDPGAGHLHGSYLYLTDGKIIKVQASGAMTPITMRGMLAPGVPVPSGKDNHLVIHSIAVRPAGKNDSKNKRHVVISAGLSGYSYNDYICEMAPDGLVQPLVALRTCPDLPGLKGSLLDPILNMDHLGNIFVSGKNGLIAHISPNGRASYLAGDLSNSADPLPKDGRGENATISFITATALDLETGYLYIADCRTIRRVSPKGEVVTVVGLLENQHSWANGIDGHFQEGTPVGARHHCLGRSHGLASHQGVLYIADQFQNSIRALDLRNNTLYTLVGNPAGDVLKERPLAAFSPDLPADDWATLPSPRCLTVHDSKCVVGTPGGLLHFELPEGTFRAGVRWLTEEVIPAIQVTIKPSKTAPSPGDAIFLAVLPLPEVKPDWKWSISTGHIENLGGGLARFKVPMDATPGTEFRIQVTLNAASSSSAAIIEGTLTLICQG